jgi:hypothetical protein
LCFLYEDITIISKKTNQFFKRLQKID